MAQDEEPDLNILVKSVIKETVITDRVLTDIIIADYFITGMVITGGTGHRMVPRDPLRISDR